MPSLFVEIKPSKLKLYFFIAVHALAVAAVLLVNYFGLTGAILQIFLILLLVFSLKYYLADYKSITSLYLKVDNLADLDIGNKKYNDLQLTSKSYISDIYLQLMFLDCNTEVVHKISIFPDSLDAAMHSRLRARLKIFSNGESAVNVVEDKFRS